jgi:hypothetical protein
MDGAINLALQSPLAAADRAAASRSPGRAELAAAIDELAAAGAELAAAQQPATRLAAVIAEASRLEAELSALRAADQQRLGVWLADNGRDARPEPGAATIAAETRLRALADDVAAARAALPAAEQAFQRCAELARGSQRRRDEAVCAAAVDAARAFAGGYRARLAQALAYEAVLHGLRDELLSRGNSADAAPGALEAAARISELITQAKGAAAARRDPDAARRLLAVLAADPDAGL